MNYTAINIQGNIISTEILEKIRTEDIRHQTAKDFNLPPKTTVRDEIGIAWAAARAYWQAFSVRRDRLQPNDSGTSETRQGWIIPFLKELGYELEKSNAEIINEKSYAVSHRAVNRDGFPVHIIGINQSLDRRPENGGTRISPHALIQEYLNNHDHLFALVTNGRFLRLLRDATRLTRLSYLEFDLERIMEEELFAEFALMFRTLHATRVPASKDEGESAPIEFYHQEALSSGSRIREKLSEAIEKSIKLLANGLLNHPHNEFLRNSANEGSITPEKYYLHLLRLVYRTLFLLVIEERKLIYPEKRDDDTNRKRDIYFQYYSLARLTRLAERQIYIDPRKDDLWQSLMVTFQLFENGAFGQKLNINPLGSGIFAPGALGIISSLKLSNHNLLQFLKWLVTFENENKQLVRVNYADLDVEEFGSVYEGLLEYKATFTEIGGMPQFTFVKGTERSSSGSHYTPEELVKPLIKHSLEYLIDDCVNKPHERLKLTPPFRQSKPQMQEQALLSLRVADVACGSGHILLSAARRLALELARIRTAEEQPSPTALRQAMRDVIKSCIYGVDKNPLAVELCKVALWLESHNPGEPLGFLDHHIKCGDSIVGLAHRHELENGIANEAFKTLPGDHKDIAKTLREQNARERKAHEAKALQLKAEFDKTTANSMQEAMAEYRTFINLPEQTPEQVAAKERAYKKFLDGKGYTFLKTLADTKVAQFFIPKTTENKDKLITDAEYRQILRGYGGITGIRTAKATAIAQEKAFFHWFLEFPDIFQQASAEKAGGGGFDCILGNPPYLGGSKISSFFGNNYLNYLFYNFYPSGGQTDLVSYFLKRDAVVSSPNSFTSILTTNSIAEGSTRENGLQYLLSEGFEINFAIRQIKWSGVANLFVSLLSLYNGRFIGNKNLNNKTIDNINSFLQEGSEAQNPIELLQNKGIMFKGSEIIGEGFYISEDLANELINSNPINSKVIYKILGGDELNNRINQTPNRFIINFQDWDIDKAKKFKECFQIIEEKVKPEREKNSDNHRREVWWQFSRPTIELYSHLKEIEKCIVTCKTTKHPIFSYCPTNILFNSSTVVLAKDSLKSYSILQSHIHTEWSRQYSSKLKTDLSYAPSDCFETFPFPQNLSPQQEQQLERIGEAYHEHRRQLMLKMQLGLTKTYNAFHAPGVQPGITTTALQALDSKAIEKHHGKEVWNLWNHLQKTKGTCTIEEAIEGIVKLRQLHVEMDNAVLEVYGWGTEPVEVPNNGAGGVELLHNFYEVDYLPENDRIRYTIHPNARKEILKRLLALNHQIFEEEALQGLHKEKDVLAFYEQKGVPVPEGVSFSDKKPKVYKKVKAMKNIVKEQEGGYGDLFSQINE
jgi:type I restriction-modification system DNA methylase subunit